MKFTCKVCNEGLQASGVFAGHHTVREHMRAKHPNEFAIMLAGERRIEEIRGELTANFGIAVRPRNMNPE